MKKMAIPAGENLLRNFKQLDRLTYKCRPPRPLTSISWLAGSPFQQANIEV